MTLARAPPGPRRDQPTTRTLNLLVAGAGPSAPCLAPAALPPAGHPSHTESHVGQSGPSRSAPGATGDGGIGVRYSHLRKVPISTTADAAIGPPPTR